jgi:hypothetical protein
MHRSATKFHGRIRGLSPFFLLPALSLAATTTPRIESGVVLMPNETLVAPPPPGPAAPPKPAPRPTPQYSRDEVRRDNDSRSTRSMCVNCGVITSIDEAGSRWEVRVRFEDGSRETLRYYEPPRLRVGDAVHLEDGRLIRD